MEKYGMQEHEMTQKYWDMKEPAEGVSELAKLLKPRASVIGAGATRLI